MPNNTIVAASNAATKPATAAKSVPASKAKAAGAKATPAKPKATPTKRVVTKQVTKVPAKKANSVAAKAKPVAKNSVPKSVPAKAAKPKKAKLIRDSFTMPEAEYLLFAAIKKRCLTRGVAAKKSEVLRAALTAFATQTDAALLTSINALDPIKTGRPPKHGK